MDIKITTLLINLVLANDIMIENMTCNEIDYNLEYIGSK